MTRGKRKRPAQSFARAGLHAWSLAHPCRQTNPPRPGFSPQARGSMRPRLRCRRPCVSEKGPRRPAPNSTAEEIQESPDPRIVSPVAGHPGPGWVLLVSWSLVPLLHGPAARSNSAANRRGRSLGQQETGKSGLLPSQPEKPARPPRNRLHGADARRPDSQAVVHRSFAHAVINNYRVGQERANRRNEETPYRL
jgi:hypothetical protein